MPPDPKRLTVAQTDGLPTTLDARQTAELFGCSYWALLDQVKAGTCPVAPLRLGARYRWPTALVLEVLGLHPEAPLTRNGARPEPDAVEPNSLAKEEPTQSWHKAATARQATAGCSPAPSSNSPTPSAP